MVRIRLQKLGRRNRSYFRIVVTDARVKRQGTYLEKLGQFDPIEKTAGKALTINAERVNHWIGQGAQPTEAVATLLKRNGVKIVKASAVKKPVVKKPAAAQ